MFSLVNKMVLMTMLVIFAGILQGKAQQVLKGRLFYGNNPAKGAKVIIAPRSPLSETVTGDRYFYGNDQMQLRNMNAQVTVTNGDGWYYFSNIGTGSYIIKVCQPNGTVYRFTVAEAQYSFKFVPSLQATRN